MSQISEQVAIARDVMNEYRTVREGGAGLIDLSASRARVSVGGSEAVQFLNGLITNDVKTLGVGSWMPAAFPNVQGRLLANVRVLRRADDFLFDTEAATREVVLKTLGRFTLAGDFRVTDLTDETATLSVQGARAAEFVKSVLGEEAARVERGRVVEIAWQGQPLSLIRATHTGEDGFDLFVNASQAKALHEALSDAGAQAVGSEALEILRIEAGLPRFGVDVDETNVVLEAGLDEAVSFTKGCYIGQEIIARIHWRGHVAKRLAGLSLDETASIKKDDRVRSTDGKEIGRVTSAAFSPRLKRTVALGIIKYDFLAAGTEAFVVSEAAEHAARVAELPLVRGSWYETDASAEIEG
ncbi:MAG TPA: aminomethyltransferase family protein [Pyrinomonadaceae bacterium]|jgi:folate-binding protein YgfZ